MTLSTSKLIKVYQRLSDDEQCILQVLSVIYKPVNQTTLKNVLAFLNGTSSGGEPLDYLIGKPWREKSLRLGVITVKKGLLSCEKRIVDFITYQAVDSGNIESIVTATTQALPVLSKNSRSYLSQQQLSLERKCEIRNAFYQKRYDDLLLLLNINAPYSNRDYHQTQPLIELCTQNFDRERFNQLPRSLQFHVLATLVSHQQLEFEPSQDYLALLESYFPLAEAIKIPEVVVFFAEQQLYRGRTESVEELLSAITDEQYMRLKGWQKGLRGEYHESITLFEEYLACQRKKTRKKNMFISGLPGVFFLLALLKSNDPQHHAILQKQVNIVTKSASHDPFCSVMYLLGDLQRIRAGAATLPQSYILNDNFNPSTPPFLTLFRSLGRSWLNEAPSDDDLESLLAYQEMSATAGADWYACESRLLLQNLGIQSMGGNTLTLEAGTIKQGAVNFMPLTSFLAPQPQWQRSLIALKNVNQPTTSLLADDVQRYAECRLVWLLKKGYDNQYSLLPKEQKIKKNGGWSKGRSISLERLVTELDSFDYFTEQDKDICNTIYDGDQDYRYYHRATYQFDDEQALLAAVEHPNIYWDEEPSTQVTITLRAPELIVTKTTNDILVTLAPYPEGLASYQLTEMHRFIGKIKDGPNRLSLVEYSQQHLSVASILEEKGLSVPANAQAEVLDSISAIAPLLTVHSDIGGDKNNAHYVEPDPRLHVHLQPMGTGLIIEWYVRPFALRLTDSKKVTDEEENLDSEMDGGPLFKPGSGGASVFTKIAGQPLRTNRDLTAEERLLAHVIEQCHLPAFSDENHYHCEDLEESLELLQQLEKMAEDIVLFWPQGQALRLRSESTLDKMQIRMGDGHDWFSIEGEMQLDDGDVIAMERLIALLDESPGRFIQLGENEFITLTQELRKRLDTIATLSDKGQFNFLAAPIFDDITEGMQVEASKKWKQQLARLDQARQLDPQIPSTLQAELRDYQEEGVRWLCRLSHWGAGACLADDMGLGKTLQALALILTRAADGPTLILAPTSVCMNWLEEAQRFAPTLRCSRFGLGDRQAVLDSAGSFDVIVCSYGLLQHEANSLSEVSWHTIVADEAQAIKNPATKRSKAAMALSGDFKMITTGTPIENHLGELWNLFRFINPGLLDTHEKFNRRFANPIENGNDNNNGNAIKQQLKRLIQPFMLRRLKSEVLTELPSRTEITLHVELSEEEKVFYEALRRQAIDRISAEDSPMGQQHVKVLAEITRLRRACCHPKLVLPTTKVSSSKLKVFGDTVAELIDNKHKALVFSQFVTHLQILRDYLDQENISYQYLDGSTPIKKRKQAVDAFQRGDGDIFLISLKAGGSGLNLTAADYVIHMDPWWNPAVEDQASDRAHRMGQQRPVTIYRMVASNTIEDKIVDLHQKKRDLANSLLEGAEMTGKMNVDEMMKLITS